MEHNNDTGPYRALCYGTRYVLEPAFEGLRDHLNAYRAEIVADRKTGNVEVVDGGMVDSPEKALAAAFCWPGGRWTSYFVCRHLLSPSTILPVAQRIGCPVIVLNLQPSAAIDYRKINALGDRGRGCIRNVLENCQVCPFRRSPT